MLNRGSRCVALLVATLGVSAAAAAEEEIEPDGPVFARSGFYAGAGGTTAFPVGWDSDFDNDLNEDASAFANQTAESNFGSSNIVPLELTVDDADLEDALLGVNGVIGYRVGERVAFEIEGEWLVDSNKTDLDVTGSTGSHTAEIEEIWTLTANVRMFLPFDWRVQPSVLFGLGLQHSELDVRIATSGLTTTDEPTETIIIPADFRARESRTKLTGAIRVGGGIDAYATRNIVAQLNASYVLPFDEVASVMTTDYVSVVWRVIYRF